MVYIKAMETEATTNQEARTEDGKFAPGYKPKTTFADRPQDRSPGGWKKENVFSYQFKRFMNMSEQEFREFSRTPKDTMTMAERLAYNRVLNADKSLADFKEIADRTEGKAAQAIDLSGEVTLEGLIIIQTSDADSDT